MFLILLLAAILVIALAVDVVHDRGVQAMGAKGRDDAESDSWIVPSEFPYDDCAELDTNPIYSSLAGNAYHYIYEWINK